MEFMPASQLIKHAAAEGYAVPSFCVWNAESIELVLKTASRLRAPVIIMNGPLEMLTLSAAKMAAVARSLAAGFSVPAALHLDHADSPELVAECLAAGYTSVMLDYSAKPFAENVAALQQVVKKARPLGVTVEGEIGHVGKANAAAAEGAGQSTLTEPASAGAYARETGVDLLAVSIGNAHGLYTRLPRFDFKLLEELRAVTGVPLVLHGGSGTPEEDLKRAIALGIAKVNVASELVWAVRESLQEQWAADKGGWVPQQLSRASARIEGVVEKWVRYCGAAGKA